MMKLTLNKGLILQRARVFIFVAPFFLSVAVSVAGVETSPDLPVLETRSLMGEPFWKRLQNAFYQVLFKEAGDLDIALHDTEHFDWDATFGRLLLRHSPERWSLADHFGLRLRGSLTDGILRFGGHLSASTIRIRQVDPVTSITERPLSEDLADWDPREKAEVPNIFENVEPWLQTMESDLKAGHKKSARHFFGEEIPEKKYLDLLAGLRVPTQMPWTAERVLDNDKFRRGDIATFAANGGLFARLGREWDHTGGSWVGFFLRGQFRFNILKVDEENVLLRIETMKQKGRDHKLFDARFEIPVGRGVLLRKAKKFTVNPFRIAGTSYQSKLFARTYALNMANVDVRDAYNVALYGNLTLLDDMAKNPAGHVRVLSERFAEGRHGQADIKIALGVLDFREKYVSANQDKKFWDERGAFTMHEAVGLHSRHFSLNLPGLNFRRVKMHSMRMEAFSESPDGVYPSRLEWNFEDTNYAANRDERMELTRFIQSIAPGLTARKERKKFHVSFQLRLHAAAVSAHRRLDENQVWREAASILFNDPELWKDEESRRRWRSQNEDLYIYNKVALWTRAFRKRPDENSYRDWHEHFLKWQKSNGWDAFGVQLLTRLTDPEHYFLKLSIVDETTEVWSHQEGIDDTVVYPDDWEYFEVPL